MAFPVSLTVLIKRIVFLYREAAIVAQTLEYHCA